MEWRAKMSEPRLHELRVGRGILCRYVNLAYKKSESCRLEQIGNHREVRVRFVRGQEAPDGLGWQPPTPGQFGF